MSREFQKKRYADMPKDLKRPLPEDWPAAAALDAAAWSAAVSFRSLRDHGPGHHWRPETRKVYARAYGCFLMFLESNGLLQVGIGPAQRVTREVVIAHFTALKERISAHTLSQQHRAFALAVEAMVPGQDFSWLRRLPTRPTQREIDASKDERPVADPVVVIDKMTKLLRKIEKADRAGKRRTVKVARTYRDGLILMMLSWEPLRRLNFSALTIGKHVFIDDESIQIAFDMDEMKNDQGRLVVVPDWLDPFVRQYLDVWRPVILMGTRSDALWVGSRRGRLQYQAMYHAICRASKELLGEKLMPHSFRYGAATTILTADPGKLADAAGVLGHQNQQTVSSVYNKSGTAPAYGAWRGILDTMAPARLRATDSLD
jgi:integrase